MISIAADNFDLTMNGIETGLRVSHIATFPAITCSVDVTVGNVRADPRFRGFDQIPVERDDHIIGVFAPSDQANGDSIEQHMTPLDDTYLIAADTPLTQFVDILDERPYRLVLRGSKIEGIVTWSDLQKLPVRMFVYSLVSYLELLMQELITRTSDDETWLLTLREDRQKRLRQQFVTFQKRQLEPALIEFTTFDDKRMAITSLLTLQEDDAAVLLEIQQTLRNKTAHPGIYAESGQSVKDFSRRLRSTKDWIARLAHELQELNLVSPGGEATR